MLLFSATFISLTIIFLWERSMLLLLQSSAQDFLVQQWKTKRKKLLSTNNKEKLTMKRKKMFKNGKLKELRLTSLLSPIFRLLLFTLTVCICVCVAAGIYLTWMFCFVMFNNVFVCARGSTWWHRKKPKLKRNYLKFIPKISTRLLILLNAGLLRTWNCFGGGEKQTTFEYKQI